MGLFESIGLFLEKGGPVLLAIMAVTFVLWLFIVERIMYFSLVHKKVCEEARNAWNQRSEHSSWHAHQVRAALVSNVRLNCNSGLGFIAAMVALCPMFGLLGTVTGMIEVFDVMAITGSSNARAMAGGVSKATIPTMAGMVAALSGLFLSFQLQKTAKKRTKELADQLVLAD